MAKKIKPFEDLKKVNWKNVADYESDENHVTLLDKSKRIIGHYAKGRFTVTDLYYYKAKYVGLEG